MFFYDILFLYFFIKINLIFLFIMFIYIFFILLFNSTHLLDREIERVDAYGEEDDEEEDDEEDEEEDDEEDDDKKKDDISLLNSIDDSKDRDLKVFKKTLMDVKKSFHNYWENYYHWNYKYNGHYQMFNWFRFNHWNWTPEDYENLKKKSDYDYEMLKISWLKFQEAYLRIPKNRSYHALATRIFLEHSEKLQSIKKSIKNYFSK